MNLNSEFVHVLRIDSPILADDATISSRNRLIGDRGPIQCLEIPVLKTVLHPCQTTQDNKESSGKQQSQPGDSLSRVHLCIPNRRQFVMKRLISHTGTIQNERGWDEATLWNPNPGSDSI